MRPLHIDVLAYKPTGDCVFCFAGHKAQFRVWSREWSMLLDLCRKHAGSVLRHNREVRP
jgi:hypothetical protein